jgi:hypothetical protein
MQIMNYIDAENIGGCEGCESRKEWLMTHPVQVVAITGVVLLIVTLIVKGR